MNYVLNLIGTPVELGFQERGGPQVRDKLLAVAPSQSTMQNGHTFLELAYS